MSLRSDGNRFSEYYGLVAFVLYELYFGALKDLQCKSLLFPIDDKLTAIGTAGHFTIKIHCQAFFF